MNNKTHPIKFVSISIDKPAIDVYRYVSNPENWPAWLDFIQSIVKEKDAWYAESVLGKIKIDFAADNNFGVMDHFITLPDTTKIYNPFRVTENGKGSELVFTLFKLPHITEEAFDNDALSVLNDLKALKNILEKAS